MIALFSINRSCTPFLGGVELCELGCVRFSLTKVGLTYLGAIVDKLTSRRIGSFRIFLNIRGKRNAERLLAKYVLSTYDPLPWLFC